MRTRVYPKGHLPRIEKVNTIDTLLFRNNCSFTHILSKNFHSLKNTLFWCPYFVKKTSILTKTHCSHVIFFEYSMENPLLPCPYLVKKSQFCQNYNILWQKIVNRMPFSSDFSRKNYCPNAHVLSKRRTLSKKHIASCPYFVERTSIFSKTLYSHVIFLTFTWKTPCCHVYIWSKNRQFCQNYLYYGSKKSIGCSFFFRFSTEKSPLSCPYFVKKTSTLKKIHCSQVHILSKNVQSLKNTVLWCQFFKFFTKTPCCQAHIWLKKRQFCQNYTILWTSQKDVLFLPIFHKK